MNDTAKILADYIKEEMRYEGHIELDADLLEERILDSFSIVQMAMFIQERFEIELDAEDLVRHNLSTLSNMLNLIDSKRPG
jgi:acyl carrier protein